MRSHLLVFRKKHALRLTCWWGNNLRINMVCFVFTGFCGDRVSRCCFWGRMWLRASALDEDLLAPRRGASSLYGLLQRLPAHGEQRLQVRRWRLPASRRAPAPLPAGPAGRWPPLRRRDWRPWSRTGTRWAPVSTTSAAATAAPACRRCSGTGRPPRDASADPGVLLDVLGVLVGDVLHYYCHQADAWELLLEQEESEKLNRREAVSQNVP